MPVRRRTKKPKKSAMSSSESDDSSSSSYESSSTSESDVSSDSDDESNVDKMGLLCVTLSCTLNGRIILDDAKIRRAPTTRQKLYML